MTSATGSPPSLTTPQPLLFQPITIGPLTLANRVVVPPMCQYSAEDGNLNEWHLVHYGSFIASSAGLVILEATAVSADGRITPHDVGLYSDDNQAALTATLQKLRRIAPVPVGIQLAHAGRKASCQVPWQGGTNIAPQAPGGWVTKAPSSIPHAAGDSLPHALSTAEIAQIRQDFVASAKRAEAAGVQAIELHMAHGYLIHQFLSPLSNARTDEYGGSLANRLRFALEIFSAVREAVSAGIPVWARVSATDWVEGGWDLDSTIALSRELKALGAPLIHVSTGGLSTAQRIPLASGYQVSFAQAIKAQADIPTIAVGLITDPGEAEKILQANHADAIAIGRAALYDPRWPWHAAAALGATVDAPQQYWRSQPHHLKQLFRTA